MADATNNYEVTYILGEATASNQASQILKSLTESIEKLGGTTTKQEVWGKRELAYPIKRNRAGFYTTLWIELPKKQLSALERELRFDEQIIRSLITLAYTSAQPGSLYPVAEEEKEEKKPAKNKHTEEVEAGSAEAQLRMGSSKPAKTAKAKKEKESATPQEDEVSETERLQKLDEALGDILKDEA